MTAFACGSTTTPSSGSDTCKAQGDYPKTGCGVDVGQTIANLRFDGRVAGPGSERKTMSLADYHNPSGSKKYKYMLLNVAAIWCNPCKEEAKELTKLFPTYDAKGVVFLSDVLQNASRQPATFGREQGLDGPVGGKGPDRPARSLGGEELEPAVPAQIEHCQARSGALGHGCARVLEGLGTPRAAGVRAPA